MERWWRVVSAFRVLALLYAGGVAIADRHDYSRPALAAALLLAMTAWTVAAPLLYARRPQTAVLAADLAIAVALVLATRGVLPADRIDAGAATLPGPWVAAAVLAWGVARGAVAGVVAAGVIAVADVVERGGVSQGTAYGAALLLIAGGLAGYVVALSRRAERATEQAARVEAAAQERERLARDIHDSVLQVLALVARRGASLGGEAAELARLAGEQEAALRSLVATPSAQVDAHGDVDVRALLEPLGGAHVTVSCPAAPVPLPATVARELVAAAQAALHNVDRHAGEAARAWVLLEDEGEQVVVGIRDDGTGFDSQRLDTARRDGRLGVAQSIVGRMQAIGGSATVDSTPGSGTEVELRVSR